MTECACGCGQMTKGSEFARGHARRGMPWPDRFWAKVDQSGECWEWLGYKDRHGYGRYRKDGNGPSQGAHRVAYEIEFGTIPDGLVIDHLCRNRGCVRPTHLEPVTSQENTLRSPLLSWNKDTCRTGKHPWPQSRQWYGTKFGCRECAREWQAKRYLAGKGITE